MTPRERLVALIVRLRRDAEEATDMAHLLINRSVDDLQWAEFVERVLPRMTDEECRDCVASWGDERKAS